MSFRYINPGYAELLTFKNSGTVTTKNNNYNKYNGVSFKPADYYSYILIPQNISEIYCSFNVYFQEKAHMNDPYYGVKFGSSYYQNTTGLLFYTSGPNSSTLGLVPSYNNSYNRTVPDGYINNYNNSGLQKIWLHIKRKINENDENGLIEFSIDGGKTIISKDYDSVISLYQTLFFSLRGDNYFSNIIISDEYIDPKEQIISLPISSTQSDMTFDSETGIYTATATNQSLLSAVNVNSLSAEYGSDSTVTGIALVGNPAYKTAEGLSSLTAFSKDNSENVVEYGTYALGSDSSGVISDSQIFSDTKIADLQNLKFGWIAK